jgi:hypothetical protein
MFRNIIIFYGEALLAPRPTPKLEDHPLSAVRDCLFNVFAATLHNWRPFLHPHPEDAPCRGERDPLNTDQKPNQKYNKSRRLQLGNAPLGYDTENVSLCKWDCAWDKDFVSSTWSYSQLLLLMALCPFRLGGSVLVG